MNRDRSTATLYYFTESYPYGISEQWKKNELEIFRKHFERVVVIPRGYAGNTTARNLVEGVEYKEPLISDQASRGIGQKLWLQASAVADPKALKKLLKSVSSKTELAKMQRYIYQVQLIKQNPVFREVLRTSEREPAILYFYWGIGTADVIPFLAPSNDTIVCRFHGWDLYEDRHPGGSIPFRRELLNTVDLALPCSDFGARYLADRYPDAEQKIETARLGTLSKGQSPKSEDGVLRIVSCSGVTRVKRLDRICSALRYLEIPIEWTHIGDGELMDEIQELSKSAPENVQVEFVGNIASESVLNILCSRPFDLFINVSESEGVPVSIMEAFSAGIPVYATDVGGTSEIIDETVGKLLPSNFSPNEFAAELTSFQHLSGDAMDRLRDAAFARYEECCNAYANAEQVAKLILEAYEAKK